MRAMPGALGLTVVLFTFVAQAQQPAKPASRQQCSSAWIITPADPKLAERSDAWVADTSNQDGILSLSFCTVFQAGMTTAKKISKETLTQLPANFDYHSRYAQLVGEKIRVDVLPPGFTVYKDLAFELETKAVFTGATVTLKLPSIKTEAEFKKLFLLYLDEGRIVPGVIAWEPRPGYPGKQTSDFAARTLTADFKFATVFHHATGTARVIVASFDQEEYDRTAVDLYITSVTGPPSVKIGETFSYSISVTNSGAGINAATDVALLTVISNGRFVSAVTTQGSCRQSVNSTPEIVCELGTLEARKKAVMTITVKADNTRIMPDQTETVFLTQNLVWSREKDYSPENNAYDSRSTIVHR